MVRLIVVDVLETNSKGLEKKLEELENRGVEIILTTALLRLQEY